MALSPTGSGTFSASSILEGHLPLSPFLELFMGLLQVFKNLQQMGDGRPLLGQNLGTGPWRERKGHGGSAPSWWLSPGPTS